MSQPRGYRKPTARRDSGAARLWQWARQRRSPWTADQAATANAISRRRCRMIVQALAAAGIVDCVQEYASIGGAHGWQPAEWRLTAAGRKLTAAPIMITDARAGYIVGIRKPSQRHP